MNLDIDENAQKLLEREQEVIHYLSTLLENLNATSEDIEQLKRTLHDLKDIFMLVVCGEYNAGKSTFLNALLGEQVMTEGVTPTTDHINIITYGESESSNPEGPFILKRKHPAEALRNLAIVDTPGTNAVIKQHQELTEDFIPRADLILFVTSTDRPFTESERNFLELISSWGKKIIIIVNKQDILQSKIERQKVLNFVKEQAQKTLNIDPQIFGLMAKVAYQAKQTNDATVLETSGLASIENYIQKNVAGTYRLALKMKTPLGVGKKLLEHYANVLNKQLNLLEKDRLVLDEVSKQYKQFKHDLRGDFKNHLTYIKGILLEVERRGEIFFDDTIRLGRALKLMQTQEIQKRFEKEVIRGADQKIDKSIHELVDWFIQQNLRLWEDIMTYIKEHRKAGQDKIIGNVGGRFQYDRNLLIHNLEQSAAEVLKNYDQKVEAAKLADSLQGAMLRSGLIQLGGVGLGAALIAMLSGFALGLGILAGLAVVGTGIFVIPNQRRKAKKDLHVKMQGLRDGLKTTLSEQFELELKIASDKLRDTISPYTRFVRSELEHINELKGNLNKVKEDIRVLTKEIDLLQLSDLRNTQVNE